MTTIVVGDTSPTLIDIDSAFIVKRLRDGLTIGYIDPIHGEVRTTDTVDYDVTTIAAPDHVMNDYLTLLTAIRRYLGPTLINAVPEMWCTTTSAVDLPYEIFQYGVKVDTINHNLYHWTDSLHVKRCLPANIVLHIPMQVRLSRSGLMALYVKRMYADQQDSDLTDRDIAFDTKTVTVSSPIYHNWHPDYNNAMTELTKRLFTVPIPMMGTTVKYDMLTGEHVLVNPLQSI